MLFSTLALLVTGIACGQARHSQEPPPAEANTGGVASTGGTASTLAGGTRNVEGGSSVILGGSAFIPVTGGWPSSPPAWTDRCKGVKPIALDALPACSSEAATVLHERAASAFPLAVDSERVYFVNQPLQGEPCERELCPSLVSVPKNGGDALVYLGTPQHLAVDGSSIYWTANSLNVTPKQGGEPEPIWAAADGVIVTGGAIYTVEFSEPDHQATRLLRFSAKSLSTEPVTLADFPQYLYSTHPLFSDGEWVYIVPSFSLAGTAQPVYSVRLADGERRLLGSVNSLGGATLAPNALYLAEQSNGHLKRIDLRDGSTTSLCVSVSPRALAVDSTHIYFNSWPYLMGQMSRGELVRMALDGSDPCVVGGTLEFGTTPVLDDEFVYWITAGRLYKRPK